jgi:uracil-DNA glycosylase
MNPDQVTIEESWRGLLAEEFREPYFDKIKATLVEKKNQGIVIYPPGPLIFNAFNLTPVKKVKVVILGQDPYHGPGEAMGLCFSVPKGTRIPPSLLNIYKELEEDVGCKIPDHGDLTEWANQGVFLLNAMLTVEHKRPGSHKDIGWQTFTDHVIHKLSSETEGLIFLLWGRFAQSKAPLIDQLKHYVLTAAHPSPLARNAFFGSKHFSKTNQLLQTMDKAPINWQLS